MKTRLRFFAAVAAAMLLVFLTAHPVAAQAVYGSIFGTVTDPQGAAIPGAKVVVTSVERGTTAEFTTNESGNYTITRLIPGTYNVRVESANFKAFEAKDVRVFADQGQRVDSTLQLGGTSETVTVTAEDVAQLKTDRADVAQTFTERQIEELPIFNRNFTEFQLLTPGTQRLQWQHASSENPQGSTQIMVNGQHFSGTSFQLDGTDNRDPILGIIVVNPGLESVTEAKIATQNYDAEFGQALAAVVTAQTKSGTNDWHGTAFWFRRNDELLARNPFTQSTRNALTNKFLPDQLWNQFGGNFGGPIIPNRTFFFIDYQATRQKVGSSLQANLPAFPSDAARTACLGSGDCDLSLYGVPITDGPGGPAFAGGVIPAARVSPQARRLLALLPAPTRAGTENNFVGSGNGAFDQDQGTIRLDHTWSDRFKMFGRYSQSKFKQAAPGLYGELVGGPGLGIAGFGGSSQSRNHSVAAGFDYTFSPTLLTDFRFGWFRYKVAVNPNGLGTTPAADLGIPGLNLGDDFTSGLPAFFINGTAGFAFGYGLSDRLNRCNCPLDQRENQYQYVNNWTKIAGNHQIKFGGDLRFANNLRVPSDAHRAGELTFEQNRTGLGLATFLLGDVTSFARFYSQTTNAGERQKRLFFYGQDTFRITPRVTFNYGLRWELYFPQEVTCDGCGGFLDLGSRQVRVAGVGDFDRQMNVEMTRKTFAPRLGLAWQVYDKTVIRLGYGRSFDIGVFGSLFGHSVTQNLPVLTRQSINNGNTGVAFNLAAGPPLPTLLTPGSDGAIPLGFASPGVPVDAAANKNYSILPDPMRIPTVDAWNVTVQQELTNTMNLELAYVGNKGTHVFAGNGPDFNCNQARLRTEAERMAGVGFNDTRPYFSSVGLNADQRCLLNVASNNYHALQTKLDKRFSQGLQFIAHYTWAKGQNFDGNYYIWNPRLQYGPTDFDRTHVFVFSQVYELPFGRGKMFGSDWNPVLNALLGGWQINSNTTLQSGLPFNPFFDGRCPDTGPCRADVTGDPNTGGDRNQFYDSDAFTDPTLGQSEPSTFGNLPRNRLRGPGFWQTDASLFKNFRFTERVNFQFRTEAFNLFNHVNLDNPQANLNSSQVGQITNIAYGGAAQMRQLQFGLRLTF